MVISNYLIILAVLSQQAVLVKFEEPDLPDQKDSVKKEVYGTIALMRKNAKILSKLSYN